MKVVILAGGRGTRISEETEVIPKPMVQIGGKPMLWHIMKMYSHFGFNDFVICLGYKGHIVKEYFSHYFMYMSDITIDLSKNSVKTLSSATEPWKITLVDTGLETATGGRLKMVQKYIGKQPFMLTYGDGVGDINLRELMQVHKKSKKLATLSAIRPEGRFGLLDVDAKGGVKSFLEKPKSEVSWTNVGFFVLEPGIFDYINGDVMWEKAPLERLAADKELNCFKHEGFWKCMDTLRDKIELEKFWQENKAPWKMWK